MWGETGPEMCDISFVALTWNSRAYVRRCVESIADRCEADRLAFEILVVDNGSTDGTVPEVDIIRAEGRIPLHLIGLAENRGTTLPRNLALKQARGGLVCIIDSDTEFQSGSLRPVVRLLEGDPTLGIVAPRLLLPDGSVQHSVKRFPTLLNKLQKIPRIVLGGAVPQPDFYAPFPFDACVDVDTAISACWVFRRTLLDTIGLLDEGIFYAPEDVEYCARVREAQLRILYYPYLTILHHTQQITHRRPFSATSASHLKGLLRYHRRHGGWFRRPSVGPIPRPDTDRTVRSWIAERGPEARP